MTNIFGPCRFTYRLKFGGPYRDRLLYFAGNSPVGTDDAASKTPQWNSRCNEDSDDGELENQKEINSCDVTTYADASEYPYQWNGK